MTRIQLSDAQAVILSTACARGDGMVFPVTTGLKGGAVGNVCKSLLKRGLIEEVAATDLETVWRHDEERGPITLRATPLACSTLGITEGPEGQADGQQAPEDLGLAEDVGCPLGLDLHDQRAEFVHPSGRDLELDAGVDGIVLSDYGKGLLSDDALRAFIAAGRVRRPAGSAPVTILGGDS